MPRKQQRPRVPSPSAKTYSDEDLLNAVRQSGGIVSRVAEILGCTRVTVYNRIAENPSLKEELKHAAEGTDDLAESVLKTAIANGDTATAKWWLERRRRGIYAPTASVQVDGHIVITRLGNESLLEDLLPKTEEE